MDLKIKKFFLFIVLILLQSCSGGRIGNFLESSFKNIQEPKIKENTKNNLNNTIAVKPESQDGKNKKIEERKLKKDNKNNIFSELKVDDGKNKEVQEPKIKENTKKRLKKKLFIKAEEKLKNNKKITKQNTSRQKRKYQPQSYKIIFILKDVDPKDPIKNLSTILRNSDVNFEIEKIERFFESKNKIIKSN